MESTTAINSGTYHNLFSIETHIVVGIYLFIIGKQLIYMAFHIHSKVIFKILLSGIAGALVNSLVLTTFYRFQYLVSPTAILLINLAISDMGIIGLLFPFSSSSSFSRK